MTDTQQHESAWNTPTKKKLTLLKVLSVISILISLLVVIPLLILVAGMAVSTDIVITSVNNALVENEVNGTTVALNVFCMLALFVMGILGLRVRLGRRGYAADALIWVSGVRLMLSIIDLANQISGSMMGIAAFGSLGEVLITNLITIALNALFLWLAIVFAKQEAAPDEKELRKIAEYEKFANPKKLGFLRFVQVFFIFNIILTLVVLCFTSRDVVVYSFSNVMTWINVIFQCITLWFIFKRLRAARVIGILFASFNIITTLIYSITTGQFSLVIFLFNSSFDISIILYFIFSRRVKILFTKQISLRSDATSQDELIINRKSWPFWRNVIMYFCVFSIAGHWMELGYCQLIIAGIIPGEVDTSNAMLFRDVFFPFAMEGLVIVMIALFLYPLLQLFIKKIKAPVVPYIVSFIVNTLICVAVEFVGGLIVNADLSLWNYTDMPFNIMGQVCLQNALGFGAAASFFTWIVYPLMEKGMARLSRDAANILFVVIVACFLIPLFLYILNFSGFVDFGNKVFGT